MFQKADCRCSTYRRQVKTMEMSSDDDNNSILVFAATKRSPKASGTVMAGIEKDLTPEEVWDTMPRLA